MSSLPPEQTITLQVKIHSKDCERRIKKWVMGIQGVRRVDVDAEKGVMIVSGTIDPPRLVMMLENYGVKAEIFGRRRRLPASISSPLHDPDVAALLKRLPENSAGFKTVEVIKTVRFDFPAGKNGGRDNKNLEITTIKYVRKGAERDPRYSTKSTVEGANSSATNYLGVDHTPHGGGLCSASSSCCGGHQDTVDNMHCCGCPCRSGNFSSANSGEYFPVSWPQPGYLSFPHLRAPPWVAAGVPSAPPLPENDNSSASPLRPPPSPPPPGTNPFYTVFSDDNTNSSCTIM